MAWFVFDSMKFVTWDGVDIYSDSPDMPNPYGLYEDHPLLATALVNALWIEHERTHERDLALFSQDWIQPAIYAVFGGVFISGRLLALVTPDVADNSVVASGRSIEGAMFERVATAVSRWLADEDQAVQASEQAAFERAVGREFMYFMDLNDGETPAAAATFNGFNDASDPFSPDGVKTTSAVRPAIDRQVKLREVAERALAAMDVELEVNSDIEFNIPPIASRLKAECDERRFALAESDHRRDRTVLFDYDVLPRLEPETEPSLGDGESVFDASDSFVVGEEPF